VAGREEATAAAARAAAEATAVGSSECAPTPRCTPPSRRRNCSRQVSPNRIRRRPPDGCECCMGVGLAAAEGRRVGWGGVTAAGAAARAAAEATAAGSSECALIPQCTRSFRRRNCPRHVSPNWIRRRCLHGCECCKGEGWGEEVAWEVGREVVGRGEVRGAAGRGEATEEEGRGEATAAASSERAPSPPCTRELHSSTSQLNLSHFGHTSPCPPVS